MTRESLFAGAPWEYEAHYSIRIGAWVVVMGERYGPHISGPVRVCRTRRGAEFSAWWRNRRRNRGR